jgi:sugar lactone lactonase YvrE
MINTGVHMVTTAISPIKKIPGLRITSCCFGGKNYDELFVTCSRYGATEEELQKFPLSGSVFKVTGLGVKGYPSLMYKYGLSVFPY